MSLVISVPLPTPDGPDTAITFGAAREKIGGLQSSCSCRVDGVESSIVIADLMGV